MTTIKKSILKCRKISIAHYEERFKKKLKSTKNNCIKNETHTC